MSSESRAAWVRIGRLLAGHAADSLRRALARSNAPCIRTQCPASLQPRRSRASASRGETPARPLTTRDNVFRVTPSRTAASETVQPSASMASRMISPGCAGSYIPAMTTPLSVIVDQVHLDRFRAVESEDDSPVARHSDTPKSGSVSLQAMEPPARQVHLAWLGCFVQCSQDPSDSRRQIWIDSPSVAAVVESLQSAMSELHRPTVTCNVSRCKVAGASRPGNGRRSNRNQAHPPAYPRVDAVALEWVSGGPLSR